MSPGTDNPAAWLRSQQQAFAAAVAAGGPTEGLLVDSPGGGPPLIGAYRHAYRARLVEALRDNLEVLARALGDEGFESLALAYLAAHPSTEPSIRWFGHRLADFMAAQAEAGNPLVPHPALADLARMDWALRAAFDAADATPLSRASLAGVPPEQFGALRFALHPSVQLTPLGWAIEPAWRLLRDHVPGQGDEPTLPAPEPLAHRLLVWRQRLETRWRSLPDDEAGALQALQAGAAFATLCEQAALAGDGPDAAVPRVAGWLATWLDEGLLGAVA
ncbi:MAG: putative DNA-binding domain-containing protein [Burkholderiales bacterium]|nr:putative DNA-binding domain-containing protein [Burkholderiales bacterium]